jgi:hypothetical protein
MFTAFSNCLASCCSLDSYRCASKLLMNHFWFFVRLIFRKSYSIIVPYHFHNIKNQT